MGRGKLPLFCGNKEQVTPICANGKRKTPPGNPISQKQQPILVKDNENATKKNKWLLQISVCKLDNDLVVPS